MKLKVNKSFSVICVHTKFFAYPRSTTQFPTIKKHEKASQKTEVWAITNKKIKLLSQHRICLTNLNVPGESSGGDTSPKSGAVGVRPVELLCVGTAVVDIFCAALDGLAVWLFVFCNGMVLLTVVLFATCVVFGCNVVLGGF